MAFTLRQLRYFLAAAESGSVSGAAQVLAISQSAVTEAIRERRDRVVGLSKQERYERIMAASRRTAPLLKDVETDPAKLLYGDDGLPK